MWPQFKRLAISVCVAIAHSMVVVASEIIPMSALKYSLVAKTQWRKNKTSELFHKEYAEIVRVIVCEARKGGSDANVELLIDSRSSKCGFTH